MTTAKTILFTTDLGPDVYCYVGKVIVCKIENSTPTILLTSKVSTPSFPLEVPMPGTGIYYATLELLSYQLQSPGTEPRSERITLLAMFDDQSDTVCIGIPSTIAATFTFARMISGIKNEDPVTIACEERRARIAYGMKKNFLNADGSISRVISSAPNAMQTNSYALFNFLCTLVYYNIADIAVYNQFLALASLPDHTCDSFFEALMHLVHAPFNKVEEIYQLISNRKQVYQPSLPDMQLPAGKSPIPNQYTLTIKVNNSGAQNFLISGTAYVVFDKDDKAWIANNFRQGSPNSGTHCIVLEADGSPCSFSPVFGGGILGPGFGIATNKDRDKIAIGNFGWGPVLFNPETGSMSLFSSDGKVLTPPNGFTNKLSRVQGMTYDQKGNIWMASMGAQTPMAPSPGSIYTYPDQNSAVVVYPANDSNAGVEPEKAISFEHFSGIASPFYATFDVVINSEGYGIVSNIGNADAGIFSSVYKLKLENGSLTQEASWPSDYVSPIDGKTGFEQFRQVQVNSRDEVFVGGITSHRIVKLDKDLNKLTEFESNTLINGPWGITIDKLGTIFVANFGRDKGRADGNTIDMQGPFGVTMIMNEDMSTAKMLTLPTGGDGVTLANNQPLYGTMIDPQTGATINPVCYEPLMRLTSVEIDGAGNLWAMNNWKPSAMVDVAANPGGDGVVIFVGVATPA